MIATITVPPLDGVKALFLTTELYRFSVNRTQESAPLLPLERTLPLMKESKETSSSKMPLETS